MRTGRASRVLLLVALPLLGCAARGLAGEPSRPNVVFVLSDDQRADTISALGNPAIRTPHLDALARRGLVFSRAYCLGGNSPAVCLPSRNMLLSGRTYFRWQGPYAPGDAANLPRSFRAAGYTTYHHGKRGNTALEIHKQFDESHYLNDEAARRSGEPGKEVVDGALAFLDRAAADRPFLMVLELETPHDPRVAAPPYLAQYDPQSIPLPRNYRPLHPFDNGEMTVRDERLAPWPRSEPEIRRHIRDYYAVITAMDHHVGRLLAALRAAGREANTIIVFTSDQGLALGSHGLMGKQNLYEDGMRVPLILAGPGIPPGTSEALVYLHDLYPTLCQLCGLDVPDGLDGVSLAPVIRRETAGVRDSLFLAYRHLQRAVRDQQWKLIRYPEINKTQLFDLEHDPDERHDLAGDPAHQERVAALLTRLAAWQMQLGDSLPLTVDRPRDATFTPPTPDPQEPRGRRKANGESPAPRVS